MNRPLPFLKTRLVTAIFLALCAALLAGKGQWVVAAFDAIACVLVVWRLLVDSDQARRVFVLQLLYLEPGSDLDLTRRSAGKLRQGAAGSTLRDLEREGLLLSAEGLPLPGHGNRPRRYYAITRKGVAWLERNKE